MREGYCKEEVRSKGTWGHYHQCTRKEKKDGYCFQHHPDARKAKAAYVKKIWDDRAAENRSKQDIAESLCERLGINGVVAASVLNPYQYIEAVTIPFSELRKLLDRLK